ncbi:MAG: KH domain-containing protein [Epsilonproteobacteria bacterium]|nr:KH domain-containing protein [Campylobacterota bacterium]
MIEFVEKYAKLLAFYPNEVSVKVGEKKDDFIEILIYANKIDAGRIIGKNGSMIKAIKTVLSGCKAKENISYKISVHTNE